MLCDDVLAGELARDSGASTRDVAVSVAFAFAAAAAAAARRFLFSAPEVIENS